MPPAGRVAERASTTTTNTHCCRVRKRFLVVNLTTRRLCRHIYLCYLT